MSTFTEIENEAIKIGIGNTPLYKIDNTGIYAKLEYYNKFKSVKDRASFFMIDYALKTGSLKKWQTIIEASSGNTGIAIAGISKFMGIKSEIVIPETAPEATQEILAEYGATVVTTPGSSTENSINYIDNLVKLNPEKYYRIGQHENELNSMAHYYGTGPEISRELNHIDHIVVGIGTGGTITGLSRYFKEKYDVEVTGVLPAEGSHIVGLRNPYVSNHRKILEIYKDYIDNFVTVTEDEAYEGVKELNEKYRLLCWPIIGC
ncbi:pyridoxal-phosphate dependent enzyme [Ferroplasma sp.]|uniref:pyridoxal-phosphate dependent enzyme n=1 Tax=Ferroplasma sp. TaxID=2591003 RepID=UPI00307F5E61